MKFDFAISFAGTERDLARSLAAAIKAEGFRVFFDEDFEDEMLGRNGADYLNDIFFRQSRFCIALVSRNYERRAWAQLERRAAQARELHGEPGFLIPVLVDDFRPDWLLPTRIHFDLRQRGLTALVSLLRRKIAAGDFGPYLLRAQLTEIFGGKPFSISSLRDAEEFVLWCTWAKDEPQQLHRIFKDVANRSWSSVSLPISERARYVFVSRDWVVAVPDYADEAIRIHDLARSEVNELVVPHVGKWRLLTDCKFDGQSVVLAYCGGDAWHLDLNQLRTNQLQAGSNSTDYGYADFVSQHHAAVGVGEQIRIHSLEDGSTRYAYGAPEPIHALAYLPTSKLLVVGGYRHLYTLDVSTGLVHQKHETAGSGVYGLACPRQTSIIVFTSGIPMAQNFLEFYDASSGISLAQIDSGKWEAWEDIAISAAGSFIAAIEGRRLVLFERR
jgi:hypothetical protein